MTPGLLKRKFSTLQRLMTDEGPGAVVSACGVAAGKWWRQGEPWELRKSRHVRLDGCRIGLENSYSPDIRNLLLTGLFEKPERAAIRRFLDGSLPVVELGACIGVVACTTNRRLDHRERHVVVEANPGLIPFLTANRNRNRSEFLVLNRALGYGTDFVEMHLNDANPLCSSAYSGSSRITRVQSITLQGIQREFQFERFTLICDIEGSEFEMAQHEAEVLSTCVPLMIVEIHERLRGEAATAALLARLEEVGFETIDREWETYVMRNRHFNA
jgi:FkbM family methyltransferase